MKIFLNILYWFLIVIALIQFIPVNRTNQPVDSKVNFVVVQNTPKNVEQILVKACYDCHSNETVYPGYSYIAPFSWSIKRHISKGRNYVNFSEWGHYNSDLKTDMLKKSARSVKDFTMPMPAYIAQHPDANINKTERTLLIHYFEELLKTKNY